MNRPPMRVQGGRMRSRHNSVTLYSLLFLCLISWLLTLSGPAQDKQATGSGPVPITLNGESTGDVSDTTPLMTKLRRLFKERETNGVFRPKSNEIEKAVFLDAARDTSIIDFARIFAAANAAGATPIRSRGAWDTRKAASVRHTGLTRRASVCGMA